MNENVPGDYMVKLTQIDGPKAVAVDMPIKIKSPANGQTSSGEIGYRFTKKVRKITIRFMLAVYYDGELIQQREVSTFIR